jgi:hypothetical protein
MNFALSVDILILNNGQIETVWIPFDVSMNYNEFLCIIIRNVKIFRNLLLDDIISHDILTLWMIPRTVSPVTIPKHNLRWGGSAQHLKYSDVIKENHQLLCKQNLTVI